jgi:hypothetical protein
MQDIDEQQHRFRCWAWAIAVIVAATLPLASVPVLYPPKCPVTPEAYTRLREGMSLSQVKEILGGPPGDYATVPVEGIRLFHGIVYLPSRPVYTWQGNDCMIRVGFLDGEVVNALEIVSTPRAKVGFWQLVGWYLDRWRGRVRSGGTE